jgi:hypothetical protein
MPTGRIIGTTATGSIRGRQIKSGTLDPHS